MSKVWQWPVGDVIAAIAQESDTSGMRIALTPMTKAVSQSPHCSERTADCNATRLDEHAVSNDAHGPCRPSEKDTRPLAIESVFCDARESMGLLHDGEWLRDSAVSLLGP